MFNNLVNKYVTGRNLMFIAVALIFFIMITKMQDVAIMFFASFVIACSLNPIVDKLTVKFKRPVAAGIILGTILLLLVGIFIPLFAMAGNEIKSFAESFPAYLSNIEDFIDKTPFINKSDIAKIDITNVISSASGFTSQFINELVDVGKNLGSAFVYLIASLIIIYYFMADKEIIENTYVHLFPLQMREKAKSVLEIISKKIGGYVLGQLVSMVCVGIIMTIGLLILGVDYAVLLGFITAVLDIIPVVGGAIALAICLIAAYKLGPVILILVAVVFAIAQFAENNFIRPYVFGKLLNIHPVIIYLFLFITAKFMGVVGVIFAPAIAATICVLIEELYMKNLEDTASIAVEKNQVTNDNPDVI